MVKETSPLLAKPVPSPDGASQKQSYAVTVGEGERSAEREWNGALWKVCGDCDQEGLSTFAYVKMCTPFAWGHNVSRAFGGGFWKHFLVFMLLFCSWTWVLIPSTSRVGMACGPPQHPGLPSDHFPQPDGLMPQPGSHSDPKEQHFLAGATFNPQFQEELKNAEGLDSWVAVEGSESSQKDSAPFRAPGDGLVSLDQDVLNQLQNAKLQAAEGVAQLGIGRKMLHKHNHDHDDGEHEHKHKEGHKQKHNDNKDDVEEEKEEKKHVKKHEDHEQKEPRDEMLDAPSYGPKTPECEDATASLGGIVCMAVISIASGIHYARKTRTAIRERYGIKGTKCQDCLAWTFCAPCALCQESRTLAKNNVHNGVWYGPLALTEAPGQPMEAPKAVEAPTKPL